MVWGHYVGRLTDREALRNATLKVSGVYIIFYIVTGKYYIGSSINLYTRILDYTQPYYQSVRRNHPIVRAFRKYGIDNFIIIILTITESDPKTILEDENKAFSIFKPAYNQLPTRGSWAGHVHTESTKAKLREARLGRVRSEESKKAQSNTVSGENNPFYGKKHTEEAKKIIRAKALTRINDHLPNKRAPIIINNTNTGEINTYNSLRACESQTIYTRSVLMNRLKSGQPLSPGIFVYYIDSLRLEIK